MKTRRKTDEQDFQCQVADFLNLALPFPDAWFTAIPARGTANGKKRGGILKGMGYRAGTPDMLVIYRPNEWRLSNPTVIWLELKAPNKWPTKVQKQCHYDLAAVGCKSALVRNLNDVQRELKHFGVPLRASVGAGCELS